MSTSIRPLNIPASLGLYVTLTLNYELGCIVNVGGSIAKSYPKVVFKEICADIFPSLKKNIFSVFSEFIFTKPRFKKGSNTIEAY